MRGSEVGTPYCCTVFTRAAHRTLHRVQANTSKTPQKRWLHAAILNLIFIFKTMQRVDHKGKQNDCKELQNNCKETRNNHKEIQMQKQAK